MAPVPPAVNGANGAHRTWLLVGAAFSAAAGLVHAAAAGSHQGSDAVVAAFGLMALLQLGWAALAAGWGNRLVAVVGLGVNLVAVGAWVRSRTSGLPLIDALADKESVGTQDLLAAVLGGLAVLFTLTAVFRRAGSGVRRPVVVLASFAAAGLAFPAMIADHTHDHGGDAVAAGDLHGHDDGSMHDHGSAGPMAEHATAADHGHDTTSGSDAGSDSGSAAGSAGAGAPGALDDGHVHGGAHAADDHAHGTPAGDATEPGAAAAPTGPVISLDDPRVTPEQRAAAQGLIDGIGAHLAQFSDPASVEAAGYFSIGDSITGYEHFVNLEYLLDGVETDPQRVESIVFEVAPKGTKTIVNGMFILSPGKTMADVPDLAGDLTIWHDHQDLCWEGAQVSGLFRDGECRPAGELRPTPPMLHVWTTPQECGPFSGVEGHGEACEHSHGDGDGGLTHLDPGLESTITGIKPAANEPDEPNAQEAAAAAGSHDHTAVPERLLHDPTPAQLEDARTLVADTVADTEKYEDVEAAKAAGYYSIGDEFTGVAHYVHPGYLNDGIEMDPERIESLVYSQNADGTQTLITAMYILNPGSTMDDVPDIAGNLTIWHDHTNLCFDPANGRLAGVVDANGTCVPAGVLRPTSPMLHVWVTPNPCGPFAGVDTSQMTGSCVEDL